MPSAHLYVECRASLTQILLSNINNKRTTPILFAHTASRPNDQTLHYPHSIHVGQSPLRRELPNDLSEEQIRKEAELVLSQAERIRCTADGGSEITGGRLNAKTRGRIERLNGKFSELFI